MILKYEFRNSHPQQLGTFLRQQGLSKQALVMSKNYDGMILVNQKVRHTNFMLKEGDRVIFVSGNEPKNQYLQVNFLPLKIVFENDFYLIIDKPAGLLSIPSRYQDNDSVVNRLLGYFIQTNQKEARPHVITRLDQNTSGLMIIAKNSIIHAMFSEMDKNIFIKEYLAIVHRPFEEAELNGIIDVPIKKQGESVKHWVDESGKKAETSYHVIDQNFIGALVKLRLFTGRTHQIRVHMASIAHPIFGDKLYGIDDWMPRQALHAFKLEFIDPITKITKKFHSQLPPDMQSLWDRMEENYEE